MEKAYPYVGIALVVGLVFLSPFFASIPSYLAFVICLFRMFRYDAKVFAVDCCILTPMTQIFCAATGMSLLVYLVLLAAVWYLIRSGIRNTGNYVIMILLLDYLIARMQLNVSQFLLCFGPLCMICVITPKQDSESAALAAKMFCISLLVSSAYALVFRNAWQIRRIIGAESEAIYNSGIMRFSGLLKDPNYYMSLPLVGLALLTKLRENKWISGTFFTVCGGLIAVFGVLSYSKTFVVILAFFVFIYIIWQFYNKKHIRGILLAMAVVIAGMWLIISEKSPIAVTLARFAGNSSLSDLTTGRTDVYDAYMKEIFASPVSFLFGKGLNTPRLFKDPHNLYIEIFYYLGFVGFILIVAFLLSMIRIVQQERGFGKDRFLIGKYIAVILVAMLYVTLHGVFQMVFYAEVFLSILSLMIIPKSQDVLEPGSVTQIPDNEENHI